MRVGRVAFSSVAVLIVAALVLAFAVERQQARAAEISEACDLSFSGNIQLRGVPVARTTEQQAKGLSKRDDAGRGMLFVFEQPGKLAFWMRDTRIPLSIAYLSEDGAIFMIEDMRPLSEDYHLSMQPAKYALELAQGQFVTHGLVIGSRLDRLQCSPIQ